MIRLEAAVLAAALLAGAAGCYAPPPTFGELPDFHLTAVSAGETPRPFSRADMLGRVWIVDFIFTHCEGPCPALSNEFEGLQKRMPDSARLLTITVDPERDDAATLEAYARRFAAEPARWQFLTGAQGPVVDLLVKGFKLPAFKDPRAPSGQRVTHSTRFVVVDGKSRIRGYFDGGDAGQLDSLLRVASRL